MADGTVSTATHIGREGRRTVRHCSVTYTEAAGGPGQLDAGNTSIRPAGSGSGRFLLSPTGESGAHRPFPAGSRKGYGKSART